MRIKYKNQAGFSNIILTVFIFIVILATGGFAYGRIDKSTGSKPRTTLHAHSRIQVAAVGDSITYGYGVDVANRASNSYPAQLQAMLGNNYQIHNYGLSSATLADSGDVTYQGSELYHTSHDSNPSIVLIMLGTNDSKPFNWNADQYRTQLAQFVNSYKGLASRPKVYLITPPAAYTNEANVKPDIISNEVVPIVKYVAKQTNTQLVDIFTATNNHAELFPDGVHPNAAGYQLIARTIYKTIITEAD